MSRGKVVPPDAQGSWERSMGYRLDADRARDVLLRLPEIHAALAPALQSKLIKDAQRAVDTVKLLRRSEFYSEVAVLYSAMAVEGFLNDYGVRRLGEAYYQENLERLSPGRKTAALVLICTGTRLDPKDSLIQDVNALFALRNALVHPKTRESRPGPPKQLPTPHETATRAIELRERFFSEMGKLDPDSRPENFV